MNEAPNWWIDGLRAALDEAGHPGASWAAEFASRVPSGYVERTSPAAAAADLVELSQLAAGPPGPGPGPAVRMAGPGPAVRMAGLGPAVRMATQSDPDPGAGMFRFRLYGRSAVELSSFVPILESFGLTVVEAVPHHIADPGGAKPFHLDDFGLRARGRWGFDPDADGPRLVAAVQAAWQGQAEVDSLNRLVVSAALDWHDVVVLRAYRRYRRQVGTPWSDRQLDDPLVEFPAVAVALLRYFAARFDPAGTATPADQAREAVVNSLAPVERLEHDQVLRAYLSLIDATLRTSHYARTPEGERLPTLALKLDSARVPELPPPRPYRETFVYSPQLEGLHLRGGPIARGGIRWSDRQDDLRTEVLGLVRAQVLKNAGIVPTGAKGGFVGKRPSEPLADAGPGGPELVREGYRMFVSALLDITDNVVGDEVVAPPGVRPADGEDTYLVVAADRGTATFSDLANEVSGAHGFWLGDAFASGGRHGYDHKAMGITARGAWVAARQHFRQLGIDPELEPIRVVGVGDMSGDVFGNGMLQSRTLKLIAAFDHRHIFVDPDPDPERSYAERARLFALPGSSWHDYDTAVLSPGGGVWSRTTKAIPLAPEAQRALGVSASVISPPELVSAILTASADLLWLGGIGTFVKAPTESHADVADRANDVVRVDADRVRARVVAEGGNLGFTQRARVVYSRRGGKINTDFIDNAAGVATSDYEVNLKILLARAVEQGRITMAERDRLLAEVQGDVTRAVLHDVGLTALAVTRAVPASAADLDAFEALMVHLELVGRLDRKVEALPAQDDMALRMAAGAGLTRPEAAVVLALAKSDLAHALEASPLVGDPAVANAVTGYFPPAITDRFADLVAAHRLYRELLGTRVAHEIVDRMGVTWAHETADELGRDLAGIARAYWCARSVLAADQRWARVEDLVASIPADAQEALDRAVAEAVNQLARRYLLDGIEDATHDRAVAALLEAALAGSGGEEGAAPLVAAGVPPPVAQEFAALPALGLAADVAMVLRSRSLPADAAGAVLGAFHTVDSALGLPGVGSTLEDIPNPGRWGRWQARRLGDDLASLRRDVVLAALADASSPSPDGPADRDPSDVVARWLATRGVVTSRFHRLAGHLRDPDADVACVAALAVRALEELVPPSRSGPPDP